MASSEKTAPTLNRKLIDSIVSGLSLEEQVVILDEIERFFEKNPDGARRLLVNNPEVAQAILQMQVLFGLVRAGDIQSLQSAKQRTTTSVETTSATATAAFKEVAVEPMHVEAPLPPVQRGMQPAQPPVAASMRQLQQQQQADVGIPRPLTPEQQALLQQVAQLKPEQIKQLPLQVQQQIFELQQTMVLSFLSLSLSLSLLVLVSLRIV